MRSIVQHIASILVVSFIVAGCNNNSSQPIQDVIEFVDAEDNRLKVESVFPNSRLDYQLEYLPYAVLAAQAGFEWPTTQISYDSIVDLYGSMEYYRLRISSQEGGTIDYFQNELSSLSDEDVMVFLNFGIQGSIKMTVNSDTIPCTYLHREISESITNTLDYTLGFPSVTSEADRNIVIVNSMSQSLQSQFTISGNSIAKIKTMSIQ